MTSVADPHNNTTKGEPPSKKRRGGRRSSNPDISAEERKRLRILKNRESAMRSLAKKAEYSAKLESLEKEAAAQHKSSREELESLLNTAITLRNALDKVPDDIAKLIAKVETSINQGTTVLAHDDSPQTIILPTTTEQTNQLPATDAATNREEAVAK